MSTQNQKKAEDAENATNNPTKSRNKINPTEISFKPKKAVLVESLFRDEVDRLHICARLAGYGSAEEFFAECARTLNADFAAEYPGIFQVGKRFQPRPGMLRVLRALRGGHTTVAQIRTSLGVVSPLKDKMIRGALKQLVTLNLVRKLAQAEKTGPGRPVEIYTLISE